MDTAVEERVSEAPWNGSPSNFTDEQYQRSCVLDRKVCGGEWASKDPKQRCSLPIKTPSGQLSRAGAHAAAQRINQVSDACPQAIASAKSKLRSAYKQLGEDVPSNLKEKSEELDLLAREFGIEPGVPRHGSSAMRWHSDDDSEFRDDGPGAGYLGTLHGHFCVFDRWTEIRSFFEGRFMERIAKGACKKTFEANRAGMRCLMQHGRDPVVGMKPLGPIRELEEDDTGGRYEVPMFDTSYNRDLLPALRDNQYGASFRFEVLREEVDSEPKRSAHNPDGIEERTVTEMRVREFGPVTFPAYADATAGVRSLNDWWLELDLEMFSRAHPDAYPGRLAEILLNLRSRDRSGSQSGREESGEQEGAPPTSAPEANGKRRSDSTLSLGAARDMKLGETEDNPWKL